MILAYQAYDAAGKEVSDSLEADNSVAAIESLRRRGLFVTDIREGAAVAAAGARGRTGGRKRLRMLSMITRQLRVLIASGTTMMEALEAVERQIPDEGWRRVIAGVRAHLEEGCSLSEAMAGYPKHFDTVYRSLIEAAESSGKMQEMLDRLSRLCRKKVQLANTVAGAIVYPALLLTVAVAVLVMMMLFVIPRFKELFETLDAPLPDSTKVLITASEILQSYWYLIVGGLVGGFFSLRFWLRTPGGRRRWEGLVLRLPKVGKIVQSFVTARVARTLGTLLWAKVPIVEALRLTRAGAGNTRYADLIARAEDAVIDGKPMSEVLLTSPLIDPCVSEAVRNGERSGQVGPLLLEISEFMEEDNEVLLRTLTGLLEPVILIVMGVIVGLVAVSLFTPLFDATAMT